MIAIFRFCGLLFLLIASGATRVPIVGLDRVASIPSGSEDPNVVWLTQSIALARNDDGWLFVGNNKEVSVLAFDADGRFRFKFGRPGQGPGDLQNIMGLRASDAGIHVFDPMKREIIVFDRSGRHAGEVKLPRSYADFDRDDEGILFGAARIVSEPGTLVDVLGPDGTVRRSFGDPVRHFGDRRDRTINDVKLCARDGAVWVLFRNIALLRGYDRSGKLLAETDLEDFPDVRAEGRKNLESFGSMVPGRTGFLRLFDAIRRGRRDLFLLRNSPNFLEILRVGRDLRVLTLYRYAKSPDYVAMKASSFGRRGQPVLAPPFGSPRSRRGKAKPPLMFASTIAAQDSGKGKRSTPNSISRSAAAIPTSAAPGGAILRPTS